MRIATQKEKFDLCGAPGNIKVLTTVKVAIKLKLSWKLGYSVQSFTCHNIVAPHIQRIYADIAKLDRQIISDAGMDIWGGCHVIRAIRGTEKHDAPPFSAHSWGIAIDVDPARNGLYTKAPAANLSRTRYDDIHAIWSKYGFINLGHVIGRDYMHYEASYELLSNPAKYL